MGRPGLLGPAGLRKIPQYTTDGLLHSQLSVSQAGRGREETGACRRTDVGCECIERGRHCGVAGEVSVADPRLVSSPTSGTIWTCSRQICSTFELSTHSCREQPIEREAQPGAFQACAVMLHPIDRGWDPSSVVTPQQSLLSARAPLPPRA